MLSSATKDDLNNLRTNSQNAVNDGKDDLQNAAHEAGRTVRSVFNSASDDFSHASDRVTTEIRSNPIRSTAIALGIGVLLGALLRR